MRRHRRTSCHRPCALAQEAGGVKTRRRGHGRGRVLIGSARGITGTSGLLRRGPTWLSGCSASSCRRPGVLFGRHRKSTPCTLDRHRRTADAAPRRRCSDQVCFSGTNEGWRLWWRELTEGCSCARSLYIEVGFHLLGPDGPSVIANGCASENCMRC